MTHHYSRSGHRLYGIGKVRFTTWQWAVIGAYVIAIFLSAFVGAVAHQASQAAKRAERAANEATENTVRLDKAICAEIHYLERGLTLTAQQPIVNNELKIVLKDLRPLAPGCPPAEPVVFPKEPDLGGTFGNKEDGGGTP
jgi:hypothetical protein